MSGRSGWSSRNRRTAAALRQACSAIIKSAGVPSYLVATRTLWPRRRRIRAQRTAVVRLPDRDEGRAGVIRAIFMGSVAPHRPISGATEAELAVQLREARACTLGLTQDLSSDQLMGRMLQIV